MKIYWSIRSVPELAKIPEENRKDILRKYALTNSENEKIGCLLSVLTTALMLIGATLGNICADRIGAIIGIIIGGAVAVFVGCQIPVYIFRSRVRKHLFTYEKFN